MPPFILEEFKHPKGKPPPKIIFTKNEYCMKVKMPDWDQINESEPKDNNPYSPPGGNQFLSTYNRIGHMKEEDHFVTTTKSSFGQIRAYDKFNLNPDKKPIINFLTMKGTCLPKEPQRCPISPNCANDYLSTMQDSYKIPFSTVLQPLSIPKIPFLQNRKLKWESPHLDDNKFYDECYKAKIKVLQDIKGRRTISYDPIKNKYSDGRFDMKKRKCFDLPYRQIK